jgi:hypothetical protein
MVKPAAHDNRNPMDPCDKPSDDKKGVVIPVGNEAIKK